jgi:protein KTI12
MGRHHHGRCEAAERCNASCECVRSSAVDRADPLLLKQVHTSTTSYLTLLESTTSLLISTLLSQQSLSPLSGTTTLVLPTTPTVRVQLNIFKPVSMPMLQRLKRQFSKLNQQAQTELTQDQIARLFAEYLEGGVR